MNPPFQSHSKTSIEAAASIAPDAKTMRNKVLGFIIDSGSRGVTDEEIQLGLSMNPSTERPRRIELVEQGLVCASLITRKTSTGRRAVVWKADLGKLP